MVAVTYGRLFKSLPKNLVAKVNLEQAARMWLETNRATPSANPLVNPWRAQDMVEEMHRRIGAVWSWGGYLEQRSAFLEGTHLDSFRGYIHLGVDCNVPAGTEISAPFDCKVLQADDNDNNRSGWGPRMLLEILSGPKSGELVIVAQTAPFSLNEGTVFKQGDLLGTVGGPPRNGYWFPHLHLQLIAKDQADSIGAQTFETHTSYGPAKEIDRLRAIYPDPSWILTEDLPAGSLPNAS